MTESEASKVRLCPNCNEQERVEAHDPYCCEDCREDWERYLEYGQ